MHINTSTGLTRQNRPGGSAISASPVASSDDLMQLLSQGTSPGIYRRDTSLAERAGGFAIGAAVGAVGIGSPAALGMGAIKSFMTGGPAGIGLGVALSVAAIGVGAVSVPMSLMGAAMSTDSGQHAGFYGYLLGAAASVAGAAVAIF